MKNINTNNQENIRLTNPTYGKESNAIINGNFDIWQRGTSFSLNSEVAYTADRWRIATGSGGQVTVSRQAFDPSDTTNPTDYPKYYMRCNWTVGGSTLASISQRVEDVRTFANKDVHFSFWMRSSSINYVKVWLGQYDGSGYNNFYSINKTPSSDWQRFTINTPVDAISSITGTDHYFYFTLEIWNVGVTGIIDFAQFQLNEGSILLPYQKRHYQEELALCQRYYTKSYLLADAPGSGNGKGALRKNHINSNQTVVLHSNFPVNMRKVPTLNVYSSSGTVDKMRNNDTSTDIDATITGNEREVTIESSSAQNNDDQHIAQYTADAEL